MPNVDTNIHHLNPKLNHNTRVTETISCAFFSRSSSDWGSLSLGTPTPITNNLVWTEAKEGKRGKAEEVRGTAQVQEDGTHRC